MLREVALKCRGQSKVLERATSAGEDFLQRWRAGVIGPLGGSPGCTHAIRCGAESAGTTTASIKDLRNALTLGAVAGPAKAVTNKTRF